MAVAAMRAPQRFRAWEPQSLTRVEWDRLAQDFEDSVCDVTATDINHELRRLVQSFLPQQYSSVLVDLGCGIGTFIREFGAHFNEIIGVEYAPRILARARNGQPQTITKKTQWLSMDIERAAEKIGARASLTVCLNVITAASAARRQRLWASVAGVTRPSGLALIVVPSVESAQMVDKMVATPQSKSSRSDLRNDGLLERSEAIQKHYSRKELLSTVARHGFTPRSIRRIHCPWSEEGLSFPSTSRVSHPWDWACLAERTV